METTVRDNPEESRYEIRDGDRVLGLAAYERRGDTDRVHPHRGRPRRRVRTAWAARWSGPRSTTSAAQGGSVVAQCSFVRGWIERHPDYADLVVAARPVTAPDVADHVLGDPDAPVTLLEYGDYECPYCAAAAPGAAPGGRGVRRAGAAGLPQLPARRRASVRADRGPGRRGGRRPGRLLADARAALRPAGPARRRGAARLRRRARARRQPGGRGRRPRCSATRSRPTSPPASRPGVGRHADRLHRRPAVRRAGSRPARCAGRSGRLGANGSDPDGRRDPGPGRQRRWSLGLRRAQREPLAEDPQQDDPGDRCGY